MNFLVKIYWRGLCLGLLLALTSQSASAQLLPLGPARSYEFRTMTVYESSAKAYARLVFAPAFNEHTELELEGLNTLTADKARDNQRHNAEVVNQSLSQLSAAGWELIEVHSGSWVRDPSVQTTNYLFRKAKS